MIRTALFFMLVFCASAWAYRAYDMERRVQEKFFWVQMTYSNSQWCVNAQPKPNYGGLPGVFVGGCWATEHEAIEGVLASKP